VKTKYERGGTAEELYSCHLDMMITDYFVNCLDFPESLKFLIHLRDKGLKLRSPIFESVLEVFLDSSPTYPEQVIKIENILKAL